jgi:methanol--5-hydroxybenzimidazolylcobamide Co-methyltransferase
MEGKTSACAHSDLLGNLVMACCDLWSNEAVEYHDMFGGTTVAVFAEILGYDCAMMNAAIELGTAKQLQEMLVTSDKYRDTHGFILAPDNAWEIGNAIVSNGASYYSRAKAAGVKSGQLMLNDTKLRMSAHERQVLKGAVAVLEGLPAKEEDFIDQCVTEYKKVIPGFNPKNYGL